MSTVNDSMLEVSTATDYDGTDYVSLILSGECFGEDEEGTRVAGIMLSPSSARSVAISLMEKADQLDRLDGITPAGPDDEDEDDD